MQKHLQRHLIINYTLHNKLQSVGYNILIISLILLTREFLTQHGGGTMCHCAVREKIHSIRKKQCQSCVLFA